MSGRNELIEDLRENQAWIGTLKKVQDKFRDHAGIVASCQAFVLYHLGEIERIAGELKNAGD